MKQRIRNVVLVFLGIGLLAVGYALFFKLTGFGLPCPFHVLTGLYCPGCGNSRALHALLHLHPTEALRYNYLMPLEVAYILYVMYCTVRQYLQTGVYRLVIGLEIVGWVFLGVLLVWWVVRNLTGM